MGSRDPKIAYKETRLNIDPAVPSSIVRIQISSPGANRRKSQRTNGAENLVAVEKIYRTQHLATASSVFHRSYHKSPRSFLWRVLENGTVLSIRVADICRHQKASDAPLILNLEFPHAIRTPCIDFADHRDHDVLCIFLVDQVNQLWSITLRPDMFRKRSATEGGLDDACKTYLPPSFALKHPHRLLAVHAEQLIVTMHDGGILRFDKNRTHDAMSTNLWKENVYNAASWGQSLRGLVPMYRNPTIKYDKINMEMSAAASTVVARMGDTLEPYLFTVCLDHRMRIWEVGTGQIVYAGDILDTARDPQEVGTRLVVDPSQNNLIRIIEDAYHRCIVVTYSPIGEEFKFWFVQVNQQGSVMVEDRSPNGHLKAQSPTADVWSMADFAVEQRGPNFEVWVLWKNNITWRSQTICVDPDNVGNSLNGWEGVFVDTSTPSLEVSGPCDAEDATEKWLDTILQPGRFSKSTIDTALAMYEKGLGTGDTASKGSGRTLAESICSVIGATASLNRTANGIDYEQFRGTSETQWLRLWRLLLEMDKLGGEALSFVMDRDCSAMIWVVCAGYMSAIRDCTGMERLVYNLQSRKQTNLMELVSAGLMYVECFTDSMRQLCRATLQQELFEDLAAPEVERIQTFADKAGFWRQLTDEDCAAVVETLGPKFCVVTPNLYTDLFELMEAKAGPDPELPFTDLGRKLVLRTVQETAELHHQILFSQLILLAHMELELEFDEDALHSRFDVGDVYRHLVGTLRRLEHIRWMTKTEMSLPSHRPERSSSFSTNGSFSTSFSSALSAGSPPTVAKRSYDEPRIITPLEGLLGHLLGMPHLRGQDLYRHFTGLAVNLCALNSETELVPHLQICWLLKLDRPDLALELSAFSGQEPFATYVQGRVFLALKDFSTAAVYFKKASAGISDSKQLAGRHSAGLLDDTEWNLLEDGVLGYYSHIVNLFDRPKAYSFVIEFARLGLLFAQAGVAREAPLRTELLSRLFTASTALSHFGIAHYALLETEDGALQTSCLKKLIEKMCLTGQNAELVNLPFSGLLSQVDRILEAKCHMARDVMHDIPYHQILYAWRIKHHDYRGAAAILMDRLHKLRDLGGGDQLDSDDVMDTPVTRQYLLIINALSCVPKDEAWILEEIPPGEDEHAMRGDDAENSCTLNDLRATVEKRLAESGATGLDEDEDWTAALGWYKSLPKKRYPPRRLLTLPDIRKQYQRELDRVVAIQTNQFELTGDDDDAMDTA